MKKLCAFTLTEVLITLTIIGVIVSLTVPNVAKSVNSASIPDKVKKYQGMMQDAVKLLMARRGFPTLDNKYSDVNAFASDLKQELAVLKDCGLNTGQGCFAKNVMYKYLNGTDDQIYDNSATYYKIILNDGAIVYFPWFTNCDEDDSIDGTGSISRQCANVDIDINGYAPPNQKGRDIFEWRILYDGTVIPTGTSNDVWKGCDKTSSVTSKSSSGAPGNGVGCTAKVLQEEAVSY